METPEKINWKEKYAEMSAWQKENNASAKETADHFGVPPKNYYMAIYKYDETKQKKKTKTKTSPAISFRIPDEIEDIPEIQNVEADTGKGEKVAVAIMSLKSFKEFMSWH